MDSTRVWARVTGRVQGVGFRWFVRDQAENLELSGWVRNDADGSVECEFQGDVDATQRLLLALEQGPCTAHVDEVKRSTRPTVGGEKGFHIRY